MRKIIASLDIGTHTMKLAVGEMVHHKLNVLCCVDTHSQGVKKGFIVNSESAILALKELFKKAEEQIGLKISKVIISVPSRSLDCFLSEGYKEITNEDGKVSVSDYNDALISSLKNKVTSSQEVVVLLPTKFLVDEDEVVPNPIGMKATKIRVKTVIGIVPKNYINPIIRCLEKIDVKVINTTVGDIGSYFEFKDNKNSLEVGAIINIGASTTSVAILNRGIITSSEIIDMGGDTIDSDIGYIYKVNRHNAIYLKENLALASTTNARANEFIIIENRSNDKIKINQFDISDVVSKRLEEILNLAKKQINLLTKKEISYIIVTGGSTELTDFNEVLKRIIPNASIGNVSELGARHNKYAVVLGLLKYYDYIRVDKNYSIFNIDEQDELSGKHRRINISEDSLLGKIFGYFFDN